MKDLYCIQFLPYLYHSYRKYYLAYDNNTIDFRCLKWSEEPIFQKKEKIMKNLERIREMILDPRNIVILHIDSILSEEEYIIL